MNVLHYGTMRDNILGLEVVLADGRIWDGLRALRKDSSGYDLKQIFIGAEGTLGVVTRAVVRLLPAPVHQQSALAALSEIGAIRSLLATARRHAPGGVTAFELIPELGIATMVSKLGRQRPLATIADWYVLVRFAGAVEVTDALAAFLAEAGEQGEIVDAAIASTAAQEENLWVLRDEIVPENVFDNYRSALKMDTAVPIDRIEEYIAVLARLADEAEAGSVHYAFGHVGDGNIHSYIVPAPGAEQSFQEAMPDLVRATDRITWDFGGTLSAEHGIGQTLRHRIAGQKDEVEQQMARSLKHLFDPHGRLNPDKTLPPEPPGV
jgi:FAD/FMN-containing dehydrogenase